jgi:hypothetical protein
VAPPVAGRARCCRVRSVSKPQWYRRCDARAARAARAGGRGLLGASVNRISRARWLASRPHPHRPGQRRPPHQPLDMGAICGGRPGRAWQRPRVQAIRAILLKTPAPAIEQRPRDPCLAARRRDAAKFMRAPHDAQAHCEHALLEDHRFLLPQWVPWRGAHSGKDRSDGPLLSPSSLSTVLRVGTVSRGGRLGRDGEILACLAALPSKRDALRCSATRLRWRSGIRTGLWSGHPRLSRGCVPELTSTRRARRCSAEACC